MSMPCLRRMVLTREHAVLAVNDTEVAERFRLYCLPTFREGWCALRYCKRTFTSPQYFHVAFSPCLHRYDMDSSAGLISCFASLRASDHAASSVSASTSMLPSLHACISVTWTAAQGW